MRALALLGLPALMLFATPAQAACAAAAQFRFNFADQPAATLTYGTTYNYTAATTGGATRAFTMTVTQNGLSATTVNSTQAPAINTLFTGPETTRRTLMVGGTLAGRTTDVASGIRVMAVTFTFTQPIRDFSTTIFDVDFGANQYKDWMQVTGNSPTGTYVPVLATPFGNGNATGGARTATGSTVTVGPGTGLSAAQAFGSATADNATNAGNLTASFAQPVTSVTIRYGNAPLQSGETATGQQAMGVQGIAFCPMPAVAVAKSSQPVAGTLGAFAVPGGDMTYTLTVTNTGASPVDAGTIVLTDLLPAGVTFRNTGTAVTIQPGASGVTLPTAGVSYSNNGGSTWTYAPVAGYDAQVRGVRVTPSGEMAANSSFSVAFVARVR